MIRRICNRRVLGWPFLALLLAGLAWGLYAQLPPAPRWTRPFPAGGTAVFSPDGERVLVSTTAENPDGPPLQIWDVQSGEILARFGEWAGAIRWQAVSPDFHRWVAEVQADGEPRCYVVDLATGKQRQLTLDMQPAEEIAFRPQFSPDGRFIALTTALPKRPHDEVSRLNALVFDAATGKLQARLAGGLPRLSGFTADSQFFVHNDDHHDQRSIGAWNLLQRRALAPIQCGAFTASRSPHGARVAISVLPEPGDRGTISLWDLHTDRRQPLVGRERPWATAWFAPDGRSLVVMRMEAGGSVEIWDVDPLRKRGTLAVARPGAPHFAPDGRHLFIMTSDAGHNPHFVVVDVQTVRVLWERTWEGEVTDVEFTTDSAGLVFADIRTGRVEIVDTHSGATRAQVDPLPPIANGWHACDSGEPITGPYLLLSAVEGDPGEPGWTTRLFEWLPSGLGGDGLARSVYAVAVVDTRDGRVRFRHCDPSFMPTFGHFGNKIAQLSPDGASLLTAHQYGEQRMLACYDIPERRPLAWVVGVPLALGVTLIAIRGGWRRLRRRKRPPITGATRNSVPA